MGQKQGLSNLIETAKLLESKRIRFVLVGDGNDKPHLVAKTKDLGLKNVSFVPLQPNGLYESMLRAADVLLLNQRASVKDMALPGKLTSYFASGRPVIAAIAPGSDADREIRKSQAGISVPPDDPAALASAVLSLRHDPARGDRLGLAGIEYAKRLLAKSQAFAAYDVFLDRLADSC
jgi:glycosyltransferase involved in cell wall biosynthesis